MKFDREGNPPYPNLKIPARIRNGDRKVHGEEVHKRMRALQQRELFSGEARRCPCASGTWHSDADKIRAAIREQHRAAMVRQPSPSIRYVGESDDDYHFRLYAKGLLRQVRGAASAGRIEYDLREKGRIP